jgi:quercetin dioxygenase-like cupin family protein
VEFGKAFIVDDVTGVDFEARDMAVYSKPFGIHTLYQDPDGGAEHHVIRYPPRLKGRLHRHTAAHTIVVVAGSLAVNGEVIGPGGYAHVPGGERMLHENGGDEDCVFVIIFDAPFDMERVEDRHEPPGISTTP